MDTKLDPAEHEWMQDRRTRAVMGALKAEGEARFVGGAVRNALIGEPVLDIDIATPLLPETAMRLLRAAGLGAVPTGIAHGTVTAVAEGKPFEVTTLRRDVETFGRHAVVAFTEDWRADAARRDFTMNALYADENGVLYDYWGGIADLSARRVRFVGDAQRRIREDYLRSLRLFRFHARYGEGEIDSSALAAAAHERAGLKLLSGERVQKEMLRLLEAKNPVPSLAAMQGCGILPEIVPENGTLERLAQLVAIDNANHAPSPPIVRLAALLPDAVAARAVAARWKLSNADRERLTDALVPDERIDAGLSAEAARKLVYRLGQRCFLDQLLLRWAASGAGADDPRWRALAKPARDFVRPRFPLDGRDAMAAGIEEGPRIGELLHEIEEFWIDAGFAPPRDALLKRLKDRVLRPRR